MPRSSIRRIFNAAKELMARGETVIPLHIGDPDFDMPERIIEGVTKAMRAGETHYSPVPGIPQLRQAIAEHVAKRFGLPFTGETDPEADVMSMQRITCSQGATQALNGGLQLTCDRGDSILLPMVHFPNYIQQTTLAGVRPRLYPMDEQFQPVLESLDDLCDHSTRAILINSPSNPTGALFPPDTIRELYEFAIRHNLWIISDEAYVDYVYEGEYLSPLAVDWELPQDKRRVLAVFSFSKSFAATGMRMGWTVCPRADIAAQLGLMTEPLTGSLTTPNQYGMLAALTEDDCYLRRESLDQRRLVAAQILNENGFDVKPVAGGMFYFLDISATGLNGDEFADKFLAEEHVAVVPGSGFGLEPTYHDDGSILFSPNELAARCVRLCFGVPEAKLIEGVKRMARFIAKHTE